jgi:predicted TIM-barrel fold metal-dependent hydrolase
MEDYQVLPSGWIDVHGHFQMPQSPAEAEQRRKLANMAKFLLQEPTTWRAEDVIAYNRQAGVQMQLLSSIPSDIDELRQTNDYGARMVQKHPKSFGLLLGLPTDHPRACLDEIERSSSFSVPPDGFAVTTVRNGVNLADPSLDDVWSELNRRKAVVHIHPNAYAMPPLDRPTPLLEAAFDTARIVTEMLYSEVFSRFANVRFVLSHCGGALPALSGRLDLLGTQGWVANLRGVTREGIKAQLSSLYVDTAATVKTGLAPAMQMCGIGQCIYGSDCGVPCSSVNTMEENRADLVAYEASHSVPADTIGKNGWLLFPTALHRVHSTERK